MQTEVVIPTVIPDGYEIDREKSTFERIVLKKIEQKFPTSISEIKRPYFISSGGGIIINSIGSGHQNTATRERSEKIIKFIQLLELRDAWWKVLDWKPNWSDTNSKYCIRFEYDKVIIATYNSFNKILAFPNYEIAKKFSDTFNDLIEECKEFL